MLILYLCNVFRITIFLDLNTQEKMKETTMEMYSPHFSKQEMQRSGMAIRLGIENKPGREEEENLKALCLNVLEPLRKRFGRIIITSGYRSEALNKAIFGEPSSQHLKGEAADIHIPNEEVGRRYFRFIKYVLDYDQLLFERRLSNGCMWLHVSYCRDRKHNRHEAVEMNF